MFKNASILALALAGTLANAAPAVVIQPPTATAHTIFNAPEEMFIPGKGMMRRWLIQPASGGPQGRVVTDPVTAYAPGDQAPCNEGDFIMQTSSSDNNLPLISRHKYCQQFQNLPTMLTADLMQRTPNSLWEFYRPGANPWKQGTYNVGNMGIRTRIHVYGPNNVLAKTHRIDVAVTSFEFDSEFPANLRSGVSVQLTADGGYDAYNASAIGNFSLFVGGTFNSINLTPATPTGTIGPFTVNVGWNYTGSNPAREDFVRFVTQVPRFVYAVNNSPRINGRSIYEFPISSESGPFPQPRSMIRCDRKVAADGGDATPQQGCVMEAAAPILIMSKSGAAKEAAIHIEDAQNKNGTNNPDPAPGVFSPAPGTRAIANQALYGRYAGLTRATNAERVLNRGNSCTNASSLLKQRQQQYSGSPRCPQLPYAGCECDEYPFAITMEGGYYMPSSTSVRGIWGDDNSLGGTMLTNFFRADRVFVGEKFWVKVTP